MHIPTSKDQLLAKARETAIAHVGALVVGQARREVHRHLENVERA